MALACPWPRRVYLLFCVLGSRESLLRVPNGLKVYLWCNNKLIIIENTKGLALDKIQYQERHNKWNMDKEKYKTPLRCGSVVLMFLLPFRL